MAVAPMHEEVNTSLQKLVRDSLGDEYQTTPADWQQTQTAIGNLENIEQRVVEIKSLVNLTKSTVNQRSSLLDVINTPLMTNARASMLVLPTEIEARKSAVNIVTVPCMNDAIKSRGSTHEERIVEDVRNKLTPLRNALLLLTLQVAAIFLGACLLTGFQTIHEWLSGDLADARLIPIIALHELNS